MIKNFKLKIKNWPVLINKKVLIAFVLVFIVLFPTIKWLSHPGFFRVDDDIQTMRVLEMTKCLQDGQPLCRWVPDMGYGYGYPQFIYYGPLPYYLMSLIHLSGLSIIFSVKLYFVLALVFSFLAFYYLVRRFVSPLSAFFGAFIYIYAPYHLTDVFNRGAVGEFTAWIFVPLILAFIYDLATEPENKKKKNFLIISASALIITHNLSLILFAPVILVWGLYWLGATKFKKVYIWQILKSALFSLLLTAWFWLPMLFYQNQVHIETMFSGYFNYLAHFLSLKEILFTRFWDWGDSQLGIWDRMTLSLGLWAWLIPTITLIFFWLKKRPKRWLLTIFYILLWVLLFLSHQKSTFIYKNLTFLQKLQFPWRWLSPAVFITAFISAFFINALKPNFRKMWLIILVFIITLNYGFWFHFEKWQNFTDKTKFSGQSWQQQQTISIFDYLPKSAKHPPTHRSPGKPFLIEGQGRLIRFKRRTNSWQIDFRVSSPRAILEVPNFYYPGWQVKENNHNINFDFKNELGLIRIPLLAGHHNLEVKMEPTFIFFIADLSSLLTAIWLVWKLR